MEGRKLYSLGLLFFPNCALDTLISIETHKGVHGSLQSLDTSTPARGAVAVPLSPSWGRDPHVLLPSLHSGQSSMLLCQLNQQMCLCPYESGYLWFCTGQSSAEDFRFFHCCRRVINTPCSTASIASCGAVH